MTMEQSAGYSMRQLWNAQADALARMGMPSPLPASQMTRAEKEMYAEQFRRMNMAPPADLMMVDSSREY